MGSRRHSARVTIKNPLGFHVRPVQRFAEIARMFNSKISVEVADRSVPGDSVMNLMSLGARRGDTLQIQAEGEDAWQAVEVLKFLAENNFFVEDALEPGEQPQRHVERLAHIAGCFESDITAKADGQTADAKDMSDLLELDLTPSTRPGFSVEGEDANQAKAVLENLTEHCFYVEEQMVREGRKDK